MIADLWFRWFWFRLNVGHWVVVMGAGHPVFGLPGWLGR